MRGRTLRWVIFGGEALDLGSLRGWWERHGEERPRLVNMYGITETTVHVTRRELGVSDAGLGSRIGRGLGDLSLYVLDGVGEPLPVGVAGELYVGGGGVSRGYLGRAELTAQRFVPDGWGEEAGARLYRTGDLVRWVERGELEYLGRIDDQVKVRGFRIELGEIESSLLEHAAVAQSVVMARGEAGEDRQLVGYVVWRAGGVGRSGGVEDLRRHLESRLPSYMVPALWVELESLPLTAHGKVDRRALPDPQEGRLELGGSYVAPCTVEEEVLSQVWSQVLGVERVGVEDNFFALGGDSIRSIQVRSLARQRGVEISLQDLFDRPTIAGLLAGRDEQGPPPVPAVSTPPFALIAEADRRRLPAGVE
ncbi:MAG TPA: AMP-binding protein, partial [Vicinamibacteria bacterium]|nr:AMP-binding protein [Vicinamibacteria bacterium]